MNINNFEGPDEYPVDLLADIFDKQRKLAHKYHPIEKKNGFWVGDKLEINLDDSKGQARVKDFSWRITEELMESLEAANAQDYTHTIEELSDALHFMVELCIICDMPPYRFSFYFSESMPKVTLNEGMLDVIYHLGLACNCLKNKPWKQTQMLTDVVKFKSYIAKAFDSLLECFRLAGIKDEEEVYDLYFKKNKVNQFRQQSNY